MKTKIFVIAVLIAGIAFASPVKAEKEKRNVPAFSKIALHISGTVYLKQGETQSLEIEAKPETLGKMVAEVNDQKLTIKFSKLNYYLNSFDPGKIAIYITVPDIKAISVSGSGNVQCDEAVKTDNLELSVSGSGNISFSELQVSNASALISGSGDIVVEDGECSGNLSATISGSGNFKASGLKTKSAEVKVSGSGNASLYTTDNLKVKVSGSGNVLYKGSPGIDSAISGSGRLKKIGQ